MRVVFFALASLVLSGLSMFIKNGTDATTEDTIGIVSQWGFPIHYKITAPGLAWAQFVGARWWFNTIVWCLFLVAVWTLSKLFQQRRGKLKRRFGEDENQP